MKGGYFGKLLELDMTAHTSDTRPIDEEFAREYIGGSGFGARILWEETGPDTDPLGPENVLMFLDGPFTGTLVPFSGRHQLVAKSPLTGIWGESDVGGSWGDRLKRAGFDGIIARGRLGHAGVAGRARRRGDLARRDRAVGPGYLRDGRGPAAPHPQECHRPEHRPGRREAVADRGRVHRRTGRPGGGPLRPRRGDGVQED